MAPGFTDESLDELGTGPTPKGWLEDERDEIEAQPSDFESPEPAPSDD